MSPRDPMSRILFVSHDGDLRAAAGRALTRAGWDVTTVPHSGHASLACVAGSGFDVLIVEDQMPESRGAAIASRLRRYCPEISVIRLCNTVASTAGEGVALVRPFTADDLTDAIAQAVSTYSTIEAAPQTTRRRPTTTL